MAILVHEREIMGCDTGVFVAALLAFDVAETGGGFHIVHALPAADFAEADLVFPIGNESDHKASDVFIFPVRE